MYIAIFTGEKNDKVLDVKTLSDVLVTMADIMIDKDCKWGDISHVYDDKEEFIKDIDEFMGDNVEGYVIGVDVEENSFEQNLFDFIGMLNHYDLLEKFGN